MDPHTVQGQHAGVGRVGIVAALGGVAIIAGVLLPWMTFYAGLQEMNGLSGANGRVLLMAGIVVVVLTVLREVVEHRWIDGALLLVGFAATCSGVVLLSRAFALTGQPAMQMLIPRLGPGLWVLLAGAAGVLIAVGTGRWQTSPMRRAGLSKSSRAAS